MDGEHRGGRLGSFVDRRSARRLRGAGRGTPQAPAVAQPDRPVFQGLEAFEGAPCYREIVEKERDELEP